MVDLASAVLLLLIIVPVQRVNNDVFSFSVYAGSTRKGHECSPGVLWPINYKLFGQARLLGIKQLVQLAAVSRPTATGASEALPKSAETLRGSH